MALKSGLLAESTWALDTMNIMLYDDSTFGYFSLNTLPGLLEVLTEHLRQCLIQMFDGFKELETTPISRSRHHKQKGRALAQTGQEKSPEEMLKELTEDCVNEKGEIEPTRMFHVTGTNYTSVSRKGLPVKFDGSPNDNSVLESKYWDIYTHFDTKPDHWLTGCGNITSHILTHLESGDSNAFLSSKFRKKRSWNSVNTEEEGDDSSDKSCKKQCKAEEMSDVKVLCASGVTGSNRDEGHESRETKTCVEAKEDQKPCLNNTDANTICNENSKQEKNHSSVCNGVESRESGSDNVQVKSEPADNGYEKNKKMNGEDMSPETLSIDDKNKDKSDKTINEEKCLKKVLSSEDLKSKPLENGDIEEPKLSPMVNCPEENSSDKKELGSKPETKEGENDCNDSSPPVLKAECVDVENEKKEHLNSTMNQSSEGVSMDVDTSVIDSDTKTVLKSEVTAEDETSLRRSDTQELMDSSEDCEKTVADDKSKVVSMLNWTYMSETESLSASVVTELMKEDEHIEDEAFQRDDPPLTVTPESRDELGRRCVCISNIIRSLSSVPGNEIKICRHPGIMRLLGKLLLLHHHHPHRPEPRKLPSGDDEDEDREEPPRVYDNEHWWWDYLDQLRENTLVVLANICGHLHLSNFSEEVCFPLLEGLLHWVVCPASVARDPMPTLSSNSSLSPQRLVLEALCKLCIQEQNVDLLLATPPVKRLLELYNVLVHLLADRNQQITREFSIVLLSFLVSGDASAARAVALQHPCVSLLVDFLETAEQHALQIANTQGFEALQSNPEIMGTSLDMLRRAASILLHMARVPDNRKMFVSQQSRLLNLVMSQILDQTVSNTLSEVLFECSQLS